MNAKDRALHDLQAEVIQAIGQPIRLAILEYLRGGEQCVCEIARHIGAGRPNVSRHLAVLLKAGVVGCRKEGLKMIYRLQAPCVTDFLSCVTRILRQQARRNHEALQGS